jgi:hypothetical protein
MAKLKNNTVMLGEQTMVCRKYYPSFIADGLSHTYIADGIEMYSGFLTPEHVKKANEEKRKKAAAEKDAKEPKTTAPNTFQTVLAPQRKKKKRRGYKNEDEDLE